MMRTMRGGAKWIMVVVAVAFVGWMVFEVGMDVTGQSAGGLAGEAVRVNGAKVDLQSFYTAVQQAQQQAAGGPAPNTLEERRQLEDAVLEQMVQNLLLAQEFRRRQIRVSDDELRQALLNVPPQELRTDPVFQTDGQFDLLKYQRLLRSGTAPELVQAIEARYRQELPRLKLFERLTEDVNVSDAKLWRMYRDEHDSVTANVLVLLPQLLGKDVAVSDSAVSAYYNANRAEFERAAQAFMSFVAISRLANAADSATALQRARDIRREIAGGADFAAAARRESADTVSGANGGDLGEVGPGELVPEFEQAAMALRPGQLSQPVLSPFGYHLIRLESKRSDRYHARHILIPVEPVGGHLEFIDARADTLDILAAEREDPGALDDVAQQLGLRVRTAPPLFQGDRLQIDGRFVPDAGIWAFESAVGTTSPVVEADHAYYLFRLDSLRAKGIPPLSAIRGQVVEAARRAKQLAEAKRVAGEIAAEIRAGASLTQAAATRDLAVRTLGPFTRVQPAPPLGAAPTAVGLAFGLPIGQVGGPVDNEVALFFVQPLRRQPADSSAFLAQREQMRQRVVAQQQQNRLRVVLASLRDNATVVDRRREAERQQQELAERAGPLSGGSPLGFN